MPKSRKEKDRTPPKSVWLAFENGFVAESGNLDKDANGNSLFLEESEPHKFVNSDEMIKWAKKQIELDTIYGLNLQDTMEELIEYLNKL